MGGTTNMVTPSGETVAVPDESLASAIGAGYKPETEGQGLARAAHEGALANYSGIANTIKAGAEGFLRTASLGLTDLAGNSEDLRLLKEAHPTASTLGETAAMFVAPEGSPAAGVSHIGQALGEAGTLGSAIRSAAFEGAAYNTGSYISDVALGDRDLSAEGFLGAMGSGALWGGGTGAAFHTVGKTLVAARELFARSSVGDRGALEAAEHATAGKLSDAADVATPLVDAANKRISEIKYGAQATQQQAQTALYGVRAGQAAQRAETGAALQGLAAERKAAADVVAGVPAEVQDATRAGQAVAGSGDAQLAAIHDTVARGGASADVAADAAHAAIASHADAALGAASADIERIQALAAEVEQRERQVRDLLEKRSAERGGITDPLALPPTERADLIAQYDDGIAHAAGTFHRLDTEAALQQVADVDRQMFEDALQAGGDRAKRAKEILAARAEHGVDAQYAATRRFETYGSGKHVTAADEIGRSVAELGPAGPPSLEDLLLATKSKVDAGESIGGMALRAKGRFVGDAEEAIAVIGGYEKSVADLARELGPAAPREAQAIQQAYDAAVDATTAKQAKQMAQRIDDAALEVPPGRMTKDQIAAYRERLAAKAEEGARLSGARTVHEADGAGSMIGGKRRSMFTSRAVTPIDAEGRSIHETLMRLSPAERRAHTAAVTAEQAARQMWRGTVMERLMTGRETLHEVERLSGKKLSMDEIIDASREQHLGVIDDDLENEFRAWWKSDRKPVEKSALEQRLGRPLSGEGDEAVARGQGKAAKAEVKAQAAANTRAAETRAAEQDAIRSGYGREPDAVRAARTSTELREPTPQATRAQRIAGIAKKANDVATALQAARSLGVPGIPDPHAIPVIGPLLSLYLKARAARAVWSRLGGKIPHTAETAIARTAAKTRDEMARAVDQALGVGARATKAAASPVARSAPYALKLLSSALYPGQDTKSKPANVNDAAASQASLIAKAVADPDALSVAIRAAVPTQDPELADAIAKATLRKLQYLQSKAPAIPPPDPMNRPAPPVSTAEAMRFARILRAANDPVSALADLAAGTLTSEAADAVRAIYPKMFAEVQQYTLDRVARMGTEVPYRTRVRLSVLLGLDLDPALARLASLQTGLPAMPPGTSPSPGGGSGPPAPSVANPPDLVSLYQTAGDRRAAK